MTLSLVSSGLGVAIITGVLYFAGSQYWDSLLHEFGIPIPFAEVPVSNILAAPIQTVLSTIMLVVWAL